MLKWIKENGIFSGIAGSILAVVVTITITLIQSYSVNNKSVDLNDSNSKIDMANNSKNNIQRKIVENNNGVSISGNIKVSGDSSITGNGNIYVNKEISKTSDRIVSIHRKLRMIQTQDPNIKNLVNKAKNAFYSNDLDKAELIINEIDIKNRKINNE